VLGRTGRSQEGAERREAVGGSPQPVREARWARLDSNRGPTDYETPSPRLALSGYVWACRNHAGLRSCLYAYPLHFVGARWDVCVQTAVQTGYRLRRE
jgi:hypothetical protein